MEDEHSSYKWTENKLVCPFEFVTPVTINTNFVMAFQLFYL